MSIVTEKKVLTQEELQTLQNKDVEEIIKNLLVLLIRRFNILIRL